MVNKIELELLLPKNRKKKPFLNSKLYKIAIKTSNII